MSRTTRPAALFIRVLQSNAVMILAELAKKDAQWRKMAFQICKDKDLADELVQEMYLKLAYNTNLIKDGYIYTVLRNLFYDYTKSNKDILVDFSNIEIEDIEYIEPVDYIQLMKGLTWYERTMFELSTLVGQRELSRQTGIHIQTIHRISKKVKNQINGKKKN
jgi:DNA-directed RNA polymerase specialized sigma24 family protein